LPSIPLSELGDGLSEQSCLCTVTPLANPARCPVFDADYGDGGDETGTVASWCYVSADAAASPGGACTTDNTDNGILAYSPAVGRAGQLYVACFPLPTP
jgi:hypothetical protein